MWTGQTTFGRQGELRRNSPEVHGRAGLEQRAEKVGMTFEGKGKRTYQGCVRFRFHAAFLGPSFSARLNRPALLGPFFSARSSVYLGTPRTTIDDISLGASLFVDRLIKLVKV